MRRSSILMVLGILAFAAASTAAPANTHEAWASGQLARVDATARSVVVKQGTHEMTFTLGSNAQCTEGTKVLQPGDLAGEIGHHVKVRYAVSNGTKVADRIELSAAAAHATSAPAGGKTAPPSRKTTPPSGR